jgi:hypothetical protein
MREFTSCHADTIKLKLFLPFAKACGARVKKSATAL